MFCFYQRTNSDLCHLQHKLIGFYNRDEKRLLRGTKWVFKYSSLLFVFKGLVRIANSLSYIPKHEFSTIDNFPSTLLSVTKLLSLVLSIMNTELIKESVINHIHISPRAELTFFFCSTFGVCNLVAI